MCMNNGESLKNRHRIFEFVQQKGKFLKEIKRNLAGEIICVPGTCDFEKSMFNFDCIFFVLAITNLDAVD